jgi:hypothetical protein
MRICGLTRETSRQDLLGRTSGKFSRRRLDVCRRFRLGLGDAAFSQLLATGE